MRNYTIHAEIIIQVVKVAAWFLGNGRPTQEDKLHVRKRLDVRVQDSKGKGNIFYAPVRTLEKAKTKE